MTNDEYRDLAREAYALGDDVQVDDDARVSAADGGAWIQAWLWVEDPEPEESYAEAHRGFGSNVKPVRQP